MTTQAYGAVAADVRGSGEPVLLMHGIGGCAQSFADAANDLVAAGYRTISWDAPGYGDSPDPSDLPGTVGYLDAIAGLLDALDETSAHIVGTSWGGVIAMCLAAERPELVRSLTLLDSTRGSGVSEDKAAAMRGRVDELIELGGAEFARRRAGRLVSPTASPEIRAEVERQMSLVRVPGYRGAADFMASTDTEPLLPAIATPTLVLVGEHDIVTGVPESQLLADRIAGARFEVVTDAGHAAVQERPHVIAASIIDFLADLHATQEVAK